MDFQAKDPEVGNAVGSAEYRDGRKSLSLSLCSFKESRR